MSTLVRSKQPGYTARYVNYYRLGYRAKVDSTVTVRMIRALRRIGYSNAAISDGAGVGNDKFIGRLANGERANVHRPTAKAISDFYERHHLKPLDTPAAKRAIAWAKKAGWPAPLNYDDISDLSESPKGLRK